MGSSCRRPERESQGKYVARWETGLFGEQSPIQIQTHCYEAVDLDAFVRVRALSSALSCDGIVILLVAFERVPIPGRRIPSCRRGLPCSSCPQASLRSD